jgi:DNA-binding CsgD family transcriptional regulator
MGKSASLRLQDVRNAFRLIGECRDLGADCLQWRRHMLEGLCPLLGARAAIGGEMRRAPPHRSLEVAQALDVGLTPAEQAVFQEFTKAEGPNSDPITAAGNKLTARLFTHTRRQLIDDRTWYRSVHFNEYRKRSGLDHCLYSFCEFSAGPGISVIAQHRAPGDRDFSARQQRLLHLFHDELGRLVGSALASARQPEVLGGLPRRLRQTLECLLDGDSEKQVASRLDLSVPTVHQYVTALYGRFDVNSRAELLAFFLAHFRKPGLN